jgi:hypothetical protein
MCAACGRVPLLRGQSPGRRCAFACTDAARAARLVVRDEVTTDEIEEPFGRSGCRACDWRRALPTPTSRPTSSAMRSGTSSPATGISAPRKLGSYFLTIVRNLAYHEVAQRARRPVPMDEAMLGLADIRTREREHGAPHRAAPGRATGVSDEARRRRRPSACARAARAKPVKPRRPPGAGPATRVVFSKRRVATAAARACRRCGSKDVEPHKHVCRALPPRRREVHPEGSRRALHGHRQTAALEAVPSPDAPARMLDEVLPSARHGGVASHV